MLNQETEHNVQPSPKSSRRGIGDGICEDITLKLTRKAIRVTQKNDDGTTDDDQCNSEDKDIKQSGTKTFGLHLRNKKGELYPDLNREDIDFSAAGTSSEEVAHGEIKKISIIQEVYQRVFCSKNVHNHVKIAYSKKLIRIEKIKSPNILWLVVLLICSAVAILAYPYIRQGKSNASISSEFVTFNLKQKFQNQPVLMFDSIKDTLEDVIDVPYEPKTPAILLLLGYGHSESTITCFAETLANLTSGNYLAFDVRNLADEHPAIVIKHIDTAVNEKFSNGLNVLLLKNINYLQHNTAIILHKYCDHENAPFKKAVIIMTITLNKDIPNKYDSRELRKVAYNHLRDAWPDLEPRHFEPIMSRIVDNTAAVYPDELLSKC